MLALWLSALALAGNVLEMPYTPSEGKEQYVALVAVKGGAEGSEWSADAPGFSCEAAGDHVLVRITPETWPSVIPKTVTCQEVGGSRKAKAKVVISARKHISLFVSDGTLVMPRERKASARYEGPLPDDLELVVGQGQSESLGVRCRVEPGAKLVVVAGVEQPDGEGRCSLKTRSGKAHWIPIRVVTIKGR